MHQRNIKIEIIIGEMKFSVWYQHKKTQFSHSLYTGWSFFFNFCCDNRSPGGRDIQTGFTKGTVHQRHVGRFLLFPIRGIWFNLHHGQNIMTKINSLQMQLIKYADYKMNSGRSGNE
jgi:hypothetical protein